MDAALDQLPGFRRRFRITPAPGSVQSEVEDDFHCMRVSIRHEAGVATALEPEMIRAPWTTCPGAAQELKNTFTGVALAAFAERGQKRSNCTHLHDLATLGAQHAFDAETLVYDVLVSDPSEGQRISELRRNGQTLLRWTLANDRFVEPTEMTGLTLDKLNPWIASLDPALQEPGRILRWGTLIAHGRTIPMSRQSDAMLMPVGNCFTFQPQNRTRAIRVGEIRDFSRGAAEPLQRDGAA